jgi:membrane protease YdiL (CAAX protease family)
MRPDRIKRGIRVGAVGAALILVTVAGLAAFSPTREFLADDRFLGVGTPEALFEALVRIPVGTAAAEEIVFRGVLLGMFLRHMSPLAAVLFSSVLFGFWHVIPALDSIQTNPAGDLASGSVAVVGIVAGQVLATTAAGSVFAWLRFRANSLVAPITTHFAINSIAYMAGWLIVSSR